MNNRLEKWFNNCVHHAWEQDRRAPDNLRERLEQTLTDQEICFIEFCTGWVEAVGDMMEKDGMFDDTGLTSSGVREFHNALTKKGGYQE